MSNNLNDIKAPNLNGSYGQNIKKVFDDIDANFGMLSNSDLYKGEPGSSLISMYVPWCILLSSPDQPYIYDGYKFKSSRDAIIEAFNAIKDSEQPEYDQDITAAIEQLEGTGDPGESSNPQVFISFVEPASQDDYVVIKSITPYIFIDERFRANLSQNIEALGDCVDMSCVITVDGNDHFVCTQNFPTLYFNKNEDSDQALYWIINGSKTMIRANGPKGLDGETGNFYIGLTRTEDLPENLSDDALEDLDIPYILAPKRLTEDDITKLDGDDDHLPFIPVDKYESIMGTPVYEGAPIIVLLDDITSLEEEEEDIPYFISFITRKNDTDWVSPVSTYNQCFARITDTAVKYAIMNNVKILNSGETVSSDSKQIPCYPLRSTDQGSTAGYAIWAIKEGNTNKFIVAYVNDINIPSLIGSSQGSYVFSGSVAEGDNTSANGESSHAEGKGSVDSFSGTIGSVSSGNGSIRVSSTDAAKIKVGQLIEITKSNINSVVRVTNKESAGSSLYAVTFSYYSGDVLSGDASESITITIRTGVSYGDYSHSEGEYTVAGGNGAHAEGKGTHAEGVASHTEGYVDGANDNIIAANYGAHAEGYVEGSSSIIAKGNGAHAEGYSDNNGLIQTDGDGAHAEGYTMGGSIIAKGDGAHAEGYASGNKNTIAAGLGAHAEGYGVMVHGNGAHAEGYDTISTVVIVMGDCRCTRSGGGPIMADIELPSYITETQVDALRSNYNKFEIRKSINYDWRGMFTNQPGKSSDGRWHIAGQTNMDYDVVGNWECDLVIKDYTLAEYFLGDPHYIKYNTAYYNSGASHAEGNGTKALGISSHTEGNNTIASNDCSHAEGNGTTASGLNSHAEGNGTTASGSYSHASGYNTLANGYASTAMGQYNAYGNIYQLSHSTTSAVLGYVIAKSIINPTVTIGGATYESILMGNVKFSVGCGDDDTHRWNSFFTDNYGRSYVGAMTQSTFPSIVCINNTHGQADSAATYGTIYKILNLV